MPNKKNLVSKAASVTSALLFGKKVSAARIKARMEVCSDCLFSEIENGKLSCGICGCGISGSPSALNLAQYEETEEYGCHHPQGSRWKKFDV